jgi:hypothetical protein
MRAGYYRYLIPNGTPTPGLEERAMPKPLALGICWHKGAESLLRGDSGMVAAQIALAEAEGYPSLGTVEEMWLLGAILAWERSAREDFFAKYDVLAIEEEMEVAVSPNVILQARADAVLQEKMTGDVYVLNWKTASSISDWNSKWFFDVQSWTECVAAEAKLGIPVAGCLFYGINKGPIWKGQITSRLIYGYKETTSSGLVSYTPEYKSGLKKFEVWNESFPFGDGIPAWIEWLPKDFLKGHFCVSAPQIRNDFIVEKWLRQLARIEGDIDSILQGSSEDHQDFFLQNFGDQCRNCSFIDFCLGRSTPEALIEANYLKPRVDHHSAPLAQSEEE